jgi:phosphatidylinositol alpha-1,6-mannosyltransferase
VKEQAEINSPQRYRILHITRNLPPLLGGMERLNWHMADELSKQADLHLIAPEQAAAEKPAAAGFTGVPLKPLWLFLLQAGWASFWVARRWRPHVVMAGSGLTAPLALLAARICGAKSVVYLHGLDITVNNTIYRRFWLPTIRSMNKAITNSSFTAGLAHDIGLAPEKCAVICPGVELPKIVPNSTASDEFRSRYTIGNKKILLSVGRLTERKGLLEFVQQCLPDIVQTMPDVLLVIIGDEAKDSLNAKGQKIEDIANAAKMNGTGAHIKFLGHVDNQTLQSAYRTSSVHIFPVKHCKTDPEGFGMVAIEAAAFGLPTVAFATGGIVDSVADGKSGFLVNSGDYPRLSQKIIEAIEKKQEMKSSCEKFAANFSWECFAEKIQTNIAGLFTN